MCRSKSFRPRGMKFQLLIRIIMLKREIIPAFKFSDLVFIMLINVKMPTIVGILTFMSMIHFLLSCVEHEKSFITSFSFNHQLIWSDSFLIRAVPVSLRKPIAM